MWSKIKRFKISVLFFRFISPGYSRCELCGLPWKYCKDKSIYPEGIGSGFFATCQYCWDNSDLERINKAYKDSFYMSWRGYVDLSKLFIAIEKEYHSEKRRKKKINTLLKKIKNNQ